MTVIHWQSFIDSLILDGLKAEVLKPYHSISSRAQASSTPNISEWYGKTTTACRASPNNYNDCDWLVCPQLVSKINSSFPFLSQVARSFLVSLGSTWPDQLVWRVTWVLSWVAVRIRDCQSLTNWKNVCSSDVVLESVSMCSDIPL